jgi:hypothetical protein
MEIPSTKRATEKCYVVAARTPTCRRSFRQDTWPEEAAGVHIYPGPGRGRAGREEDGERGRAWAQRDGDGDELRAWRCTIEAHEAGDTLRTDCARLEAQGQEPRRGHGDELVRRG